MGNPAMRRMPLPIVDALLNRFGAEADNKVIAIWHGGEPLLLGKQFYAHIIKREKELEQRGIKVENRIQTNGSLLTNEFLDVLLEGEFRVGISFDGPKDIHDALRPRLGGTSTYEDTTRAINLLRNRNLRCGIITVLTSRHVGREEDTYAEYKQLGLTGVRFNHLSLTGQGAGKEDLAITNDQLTEFLINFYELWKADPQGDRIAVKPFDDLMRFAVGIKPHVCVYGGCNDNLLEIDPLGDVYPCGKYAGKNMFVLGNIMRDTLTDLTKRKLQLFSGALKPGAHPYVCPFTSHAEGGTFDSVPSVNSALRKVIEHISNDLEGRVEKTTIPIAITT